MSTLFSPIINKFLRKIEKDKDFFSYYNVSFEDAMNLANEQSRGYLLEAVEKLTDNCTPDVDFFDYDEEIGQFTFDCTKKEIGLLSDLMHQIYFERDFCLLKAFKISLTPTDLNMFSPAQERKTYMDLVEKIQNDNMAKISKYASVDRITGKEKMIEYSTEE